MDKSGKELETLIAGIEERLLPKGFKVEARQRVLNDAGEQVAELDIVISGSLGSSTVNWLIECRDRPSEGAAPVSWIEQLVGRKERLHFDKVFAVSTTGFSKAAIEFARTKNIALRTVTRITDIKGDFKIRGISYHFSEFEFTGPMKLDTDDPSYKRNIDIKRPMLKRPEEQEFQHLPVFISRNHQYIHAIDHQVRLLLFKYDDWLDLLAGQEHLRVHNLQIPMRIKEFTKTSTALVATIYSEDEKVIWQEGQFEADTPKGKVKSRLQLFKNPDGTESAQIFFDEMPDDYFPDSMAIYGWNKEPGT